ncbi:MAG TPA: secretin N-terminal domain-containing protein [Nevskiales bacterium]|nr:secretin N-terminal domain-containing protein [Nevskiales bacterium]
MRHAVRCLALLALLAASGLAAETVFEIIELRHRSAEELLPVLRPLVEPEGTIGSVQNKLIVRAPRANMAELRRLVAQLDAAPRQLLVTVRQGSQRDSRTRAVGVSGTLESGDVTVEVPPTIDPTLPGIGVDSGDAAVELRGGRRETQDRNDDDQQLRVLEGSEAVIYVGQAVPYSTKTLGPGGLVSETVQFREVLTGFVVRPRVQGDQVVLDISPQQESPSTEPGGAISVSRLSTSVSGRLGEWIDLGAVTQQSSTETRGDFSRSRTDSEARRQVLIKVEVLP